MEIAVIVYFVYVFSVVGLYGHVHGIMEKYEGFQQGELIVRNIILTAIWPIWLPFYWSLWFWRD